MALVASRSSKPIYSDELAGKNGVRPSRTDASVRTPARWSPPIPGSHPRVLRCFDSSSARQPRRRPARLQSLGLAPLQSNARSLARCGSPRRSRRVPHSRRCPHSHAPEPSSPLPATSPRRPPSRRSRPTPPDGASSPPGVPAPRRSWLRPGQPPLARPRLGADAAGSPSSLSPRKWPLFAASI